MIALRETPAKKTPAKNTRAKNTPAKNTPVKDGPAKSTGAGLDFCPACGAAAQIGARFCGACGAALAPATPVSPPAPDPADPAVDGERRQLTILMCDLVGSTALSMRLDPEELGAVMAAYTRTADAIITDWGGRPVDWRGDGIVGQFGFPRAHEDDAERAVLAGLAIVRRIPELAVAVPLAVRVGIETGLVVVGGTDTPYEVGIGSTPNIAARLEALAPENCVVIGPTTRRLIGARFTGRSLGRHRLKGLEDRIEAFHVTAATDTARFEAANPRHPTPLVGRDPEKALLQGRWQEASAGDGQAVLLSGEPGMGKSRLTAALRQALEEGTVTIVSLHGSQHHTHSAFHPVIRYLERTAAIDRTAPAETQFEALAALFAQSPLRRDHDLADFANLLNLPPMAPAGSRRDRFRERIITGLIGHLHALAAEAPVLVIVEDAQWLDPSTLEALDLLIGGIGTRRIMVLVNARPDFQPAWRHHAHATHLTLNRLSRRQAGAMIDLLAGEGSLAADVVTGLIADSDGVPLFIEEMTKAALESRDEDRRVPASLQDSLMARLDRLGTAKEVAQCAAAIGRSFSRRLLARVMALAPEALDRAIADLIAAGLIYRHAVLPDMHYTFKHALVQDAAYDSLLKRRRIALHRRIAAVLEAQFSDIAGREPELLAFHFERGAVARRALIYWRRAARAAGRRGANAEAESDLRRALANLQALADGPDRDRLELGLQVDLGRTLQSAHGYGADGTELPFRRAMTLLETLGDGKHLFPVLSGLLGYAIGRGAMGEAAAIVEKLEQAAAARRSKPLTMWAAAYRAMADCNRGDFAGAIASAATALELYQPRRHARDVISTNHDARTQALQYAAIGHWCLGRAGRARAECLKLVDYARGLDHVYTLAHCLTWGTAVLALRREWDAWRPFIEEARSITTERGFAYQNAVADCARGRIAAHEGDPEGGMKLARNGIAQLRGAHSLLGYPFLLALYAETLLLAGQPEEALAILAEAETVIAETGQRICAAEIERLTGLACLQSGSGRDQAAIGHFERALAIAQAQNAPGWGLRAARDLARLHRDLGDPARALAVLRPAHDAILSLSETGPAAQTPDRADAQSLRTALAGETPPP